MATVLDLNTPIEADPDTEYFNDCCIGGDRIAARVGEAVKDFPGELDHGQEDWGWFVWVREGKCTRMCNITTYDEDGVTFGVRIEGEEKKGWFRTRALTDEELDGWRAAIVGTLAGEIVREDTEAP